MDFTSLSQAELAKILDLTSKTISNYLKSGEESGNPFPRFGGVGVKGYRYNLTQVINWLIGTAEAKALARATREDDTTQAEATRRKTMADAQLKELELAHRSGELLAVEDVERTWTGALSQFRATLLGNRGSIAEDILRLETLTFPFIVEVYDKHIHAALTQLSELKKEDAVSEVEDLEFKAE